MVLDSLLFELMLPSHWLQNVLVPALVMLINAATEYVMGTIRITYPYKVIYIPLHSRVEFPFEKSEGCCIYRYAGIDYIALWDSLLPLREVFATY